MTEVVAAGTVGMTSPVSSGRSGWLLDVVPINTLDLAQNLFDASLVRRDGPERRLRPLLGPLGMPQFNAEVLHREFLVLPGVIDKPMNLLSWEMLNAMLVDHEPRWPRVNLVQEGQPLPPARFLDSSRTSAGYDVMRWRIGDLISYLQDGATLVINGIDEKVPTIRRLAEDLEYVFGTYVQINAYLSFGTRPGFGLHWDDHDVFVLQIAGSKDWRVYEASRERPLEGTKPYWHAVLNQGDLLYVPRGWWHLVSALAEPSLHLTCSLPFKRGIHFLDWTKSALGDEGVFARALPMTSGEALTETAEALRADVQPSLSSERLHAYVRDQQARARPRPRVDLPSILSRGVFATGPNSRISSRLPRPAIVNAAPDRIRVYTCGKVYAFVPQVTPLIRELLTAEDLPLSDVLRQHRDSLGADRVTAFVRELVVEELVSVCG